ncbi:ABC transporter ATP-binding protein [Streptomyces sp. NPDC007861]|uniref:ABC transporter ATP-binding protein n=1 Tax=Streptomyces sp. NPDC007861 TaxID=3154893 RepID=UPI0033C4551C
MTAGDTEKPTQDPTQKSGQESDRRATEQPEDKPTREHTDKHTHEHAEKTADKPAEEFRYRSSRTAALARRPVTTWEMARRLPQLVRRALALAWRIDRRAVAALLTCQALSAALEAFGLIATTQTITALIASGDIRDRLAGALPAIGLLAGAAGLRALLAIAVSSISSRLSPRISREAELEMLDAAVHTELIAYDHPGFNDKWENADRGAEVAQDLITESQQVMACVASVVAAAGVITVLHPLLLPLLALAVLPQGIASMKGARVHYETSRAMAAERRTLSHLRWYIADKLTADQLRSGTMAGFLLGRYRTIGARVDAATDRAVHRGARYALIGALAGGAASGLLWVSLGLLLATGRMSVASAGTAVFALRTVGTSLQGIVGYGTRLFRTGLYFDDWVEFTQEAGGHRIGRGTLAPAPPAAVRAEALTFLYPASDAPALKEVSLEVRRGEVLALVGENGSGKTTLSKLLSGLYLPTDGRVTWDGRDTRDLDAYALWSQTAVVPQDFARWPMSARENITLGQPHGGDASVARAAERSGAAEVVDRLRSGLDTLLAREWFGGVELSGGQWQRIAIARAFHRPAGLLVMDEPTSALDPRAEHRIFTGLRVIAEDRAVVLVTHRLANVAVADRIVVLDQGRVIQQGTFAELVEAPGLFRELWELQNDRGGIPAPRTESA